MSCACGCGELIYSIGLKGKPQLFKDNSHRKGNNNSQWKGGRYTDNYGYIWILYPNHHYCNSKGYITEHRLIYEQYYNCILLPWAVIHHINGIRTDNRIENLMALPNQSHHMKIHMIGNKYSKGRKRIIK